MKSQYGIPGAVLAELRLRDQNCVYCGVFMPDRKDSTDPRHYATIEHLYPPGDDPTWISWCCNGCNARHRLPLREWFTSRYCVERSINEETVAPIIKQFLASGLKESDQLWLDGSEDRFLKSAAWNSPSKEGQQSIQRLTLSRVKPNRSIVLWQPFAIGVTHLSFAVWRKGRSVDTTVSCIGRKGMHLTEYRFLTS